MKNARRFNERIAVGGVPDGEDLKQLLRLSFRTLVDVRDEMEKFGGGVKFAAAQLGLSYEDIPIRRDAITTENILTFYDAVYPEKRGRVYCFSHYGKRPLALLLLFEAIEKGKPMAYVYKRAAAFGFNLEGDLLLNKFLVHYYNSVGVRSRLAPNAREMLEWQN